MTKIISLVNLCYFLLLSFAYCFPVLDGLAPWGSPALPPEQGGESNGHYNYSWISPPAPPSVEPPSNAPAAGPSRWAGREDGDQDDRSTGTDGEFDQSSSDDGDSEVTRHSPAAFLPPETIKWCAVGGEVDDCQYLVSSIVHSSNYTWTCIKKDSTEECLEAIKGGEADLINLEAGLAFTAFLNYSLKAIANELYCNHAPSYRSVAIVPRKSCQLSKHTPTLHNFRGKRSCHGGYSTATGWNYPVDWIRKQTETNRASTDTEVANGFFSGVCAPSGFAGQGICSECGSDENGSGCPERSLDRYYGDKGAFRCLMEGLGDIAFVREDTPILYSIEGPYNQSWSTKSIRDFMYLCPGGGCREINGYAGACSFGAVPANVIMASNSLPNEQRLFILEKLVTNASWLQSSYEAKLDSANLLSPSTQALREIKTLTRSYLGESGLISQRIRDLNNRISDATVSLTDSNSGASQTSSFHSSNLWAIFSFVIMSMY